MKERILAVHNKYQIPGGEDLSHKAEVALLREHGHAVDEWVEDNQRVNRLGKLRTAGRTIWSVEAYRLARTLFENNKYDFVLIQNLFPLISPAIYYAAHAARVPVIQSLRNYRLLCPNSLFFRDGQVCEACMGKLVPWPGIQHACYRESRLATAVVAAMLVTHRLLRTWQKKVPVFVALTEFARQKFIEGGLPAEKIVVKPNFLAQDPGTGTHNGGFALFVGRLSAEKGLDTLLQAWHHIPHPIRIVGDGPLRTTLQQASAHLPHIQWLGSRPHPEILQLMQDASFLAFPSLCYEGLPRTIVEAYATALPVIASDHGSMSSLVQSGRNGHLFTPGDPQHLAQKITSFLQETGHHPAMQQAARHTFEAQFTSDRNYARFREIFSLARQAISQ